jgi:hypothetical protein
MYEIKHYFSAVLVLFTDFLSTIKWQCAKKTLNVQLV